MDASLTREDPGSALDALLDEAFRGFDVPDLLPSEKNREPPSLVPTRYQENDRSSVAEANSLPQQSFSSREPPIDPAGFSSPHTSDEFLKETAQEIDDVLKSIEKEDPGLAHQLRTLTEYATEVSGSDEKTAVESFSKFASMFKQTLQTVSSQAGAPPGEFVDKDLNDIMENLDKLATDGFTSSPGYLLSPEELSGFTQPLNDMVRALLAKDVMMNSLERCRDEFDPWLETHRNELSPSDVRRYERQLSRIKELIKEYESHGDVLKQDDAHFHRLLIMIADLQQLGDFPKDLITKVNIGAFSANLPQEKIEMKKTVQQNAEVPECKTS